MLTFLQVRRVRTYAAEEGTTTPDSSEGRGREGRRSEAALHWRAEALKAKKSEGLFRSVWRRSGALFLLKRMELSGSCSELPEVKHPSHADESVIKKTQFQNFVSNVLSLHWLSVKRCSAQGLHYSCWVDSNSASSLLQRGARQFA